MYPAKLKSCTRFVSHTHTHPTHRIARILRTHASHVQSHLDRRHPGKDLEASENDAEPWITADLILELQEVRVSGVYKPFNPLFNKPVNRRRDGPTDTYPFIENASKQSPTQRRAEGVTPSPQSWRVFRAHTWQIRNLLGRQEIDPDCGLCSTLLTSWPS